GLWRLRRLHDERECGEIRPARDKQAGRTSCSDRAYYWRHLHCRRDYSACVKESIPYVEGQPNSIRTVAATIVAFWGAHALIAPAGAGRGRVRSPESRDHSSPLRPIHLLQCTRWKLFAGLQDCERLAAIAVQIEQNAFVRVSFLERLTK